METKIKTGYGKILASISFCLIIIFLSYQLSGRLFADSAKHSDDIISHFLGLTGIAVFLLYLFKKLFSGQALILHDSGLNYAPDLPGRVIPWSEITEVNLSKIEVFKQKTIKIKVNNPEYYFNKETNLLRRSLLLFNNKVFGTPIVINSLFLDSTAAELFELINDKINAPASD